MFLQIVADFGFADFEMFGELGLEGGPGAFAAAAASANELAEGNSQRLAGFRIVGSDQIRIGDQEDAWAGRGVVGFFQTVKLAAEKATEHGFEMCES